MAITHQSTYIRQGTSQLPSLELGTFAIDIAKFINKTNVNLDLVIRKIIFEVFKRIVLRTPCDTGRARGGWQVAKTYSMASGLSDKMPTYETKLGGTGGVQTHGRQGTRYRRVSSLSERGVGKFIGSMVKAGAGTFDKSGSATIAQGGHFVKAMDIPDGIVCYLFNNVRYIVFLEGGRVYPSPPYGSPQAPKGMVRITLAEYGNIVQEAVNTVQIGGINMSMVGV